MTYNARALLVVAGMAAWTAPAAADYLPPLKVSANNPVPACATPGRVMAMLRDRNPRLRDHFAKVAVAYMRHGEALGIRWDYAMFQMVVETNALQFTGDVDWNQNNFAGLGATGGGVKGERFESVADGARAHLEHLMIYAGIRVENPIAERTRKVQSWGILDRWRSRFKGPITFAQIGRQWAPADRQYGQDIQSVANAFYTRYCGKADPQPELLAEARGTDLKPRVVATTRRKPISREGRSGLGVGLPPASEAPVTQPRADAPQTGDRPAPRRPKITILNDRQAPPSGSRRSAEPPRKRSWAPQVATAAGAFAVPGLRPQPERPQTAPPQTRETAPLPSRRPETEQPRAQTAPQGSEQPTTTARDGATPPACRVWTASYGGRKAIIIRSKGKGALNYTVLDVNDGREEREAAAYIAAYARGGKKIGEFTNQTLALEKAFKLCPNG